MRHCKAGRRFGRNAPHRRAMLRNLSANIVMHGAITTTDAKAKEIRRFLEPLITKAVRLKASGDVNNGGPSSPQRVHCFRQLRRDLPERAVRTAPGGVAEEVWVVRKLVDEVGAGFASRNAEKGCGGGYLRIAKLGYRDGDGAPLSRVELAL